MGWVLLFVWDIISVLLHTDNILEYEGIQPGIVELHPDEELARND